MKRIILASIGIATTMAVQSAHAQGYVFLDNYEGSGGQVTYGGGVPGGTPGAGIVNNTPAGVTWTIGIYGAVGTVSVASDPTGVADPTTLGAVSLLSGTLGDTSFLSPLPGLFQGRADAVLPGYTSGTATFVVVAYGGSTYDGSQYRGHSAGFSDITPATTGTAPFISYSLGGGMIAGMQSFEVFAVPEPSAFALSGIATVAFLLVRRRKAIK